MIQYASECQILISSVSKATEQEDDFFMKRFFLGVVFLATMVFCQIGASSQASAQDVWVSREYGGVNCYVVTDTIDSDGRSYVNVTTKSVRNGRLVSLDERVYRYVPSQRMWWMSTEAAKRQNLRPTRVWDGESDPILGYCLRYVR